MKKKNERLTVIDFFCGAGGFSEGFRQKGFKIILGLDFWAPAVNTFNYNFSNVAKTKDILDFYNSVEEIELLPDSDVIIGSPPCVSFSSSNKSGKADKKKGIKLTESYLRVIAVKKHKPRSKLKAWFMENVENSRLHLRNKYTFEHLKLTDWAIKNNIDPKNVAIQIEGNSECINSSYYGSFQSRKRLITGEIIKGNKLIIPFRTHSNDVQDNLPPIKTLGSFLENFPSPYSKNSNRIIIDPNYEIKLPLNKITDHFYDTGLFKKDWEASNFLKTNHPFMGKMSFPEDVLKPSRTITATAFTNSRETIIYRSEIPRIGDGQYRNPTVREAAVLMGFPITHQFLGSQNNKWKLVGNAVCPSVSRALAIEVRTSLKLRKWNKTSVPIKFNHDSVGSLNTFQLKSFENPSHRNKGARFRRHPFKVGGLTVALSNYDIKKNQKSTGKWKSTILTGIGDGYGIRNFKDGEYKKLEPFIKKTFVDGRSFIALINNGFSEKIASKDQLQKMYEEHNSIDTFLGPISLVEEVAKIVERFDNDNELYDESEICLFNKPMVPKKQLYALYAINKIITTANSK